MFRLVRNCVSERRSEQEYLAARSINITSLRDWEKLKHFVILNQ